MLKPSGRCLSLLVALLLAACASTGERPERPAAAALWTRDCFVHAPWPYFYRSPFDCWPRSAYGYDPFYGPFYDPWWYWPPTRVVVIRPDPPARPPPPMRPPPRDDRRPPRPRHPRLPID